MYYVRDHYTKEMFGTFDNFEKALNIAERIEDSEIIDENNNYLYCNVILPF